MRVCTVGLLSALAVGCGRGGTSGSAPAAGGTTKAEVSWPSPSSILWTPLGEGFAVILALLFLGLSLYRLTELIDRWIAFATSRF